ncbi:MAG: hypothetical protein KH264_07025 [Actinomyces graevenitzii]|nr:hypothetical protein [Actinomyces graevenitzii]
MFQAWPPLFLSDDAALPAPYVTASPRTGVGDITLPRRSGHHLAPGSDGGTTPSPLADPKRNQDRLKDGLGN